MVHVPGNLPGSLKKCSWRNLGGSFGLEGVGHEWLVTGGPVQFQAVVVRGLRHGAHLGRSRAGCGAGVSRIAAADDRPPWGTLFRYLGSNGCHSRSICKLTPLDFRQELLYEYRHDHWHWHWPCRIHRKQRHAFLSSHHHPS